MISRNTVKSTIREGICPKFGVRDTNLNFLIDKAIEFRIHLRIPMQLLKIGESSVVARFDNLSI